MKKIKLPVLLALSSLAFFSCSKDKDNTLRDCELNNTFEMELTNATNDPYQVFVNEKYVGSIPAKRKDTYNIPAGYYKLQMKQASGYILYPTIYDKTGTEQACGRFYMIFP